MDSLVPSSPTSLVSACRAWLVRASTGKGRLQGSCLLSVPESAAVPHVGPVPPAPAHSRCMGVDLSNPAAVVDGEIS